MTRPGTVEGRRRLYEQACVVIERDHSREVRLDDVAHELATSRRQLQRAFSEAGETTFRRFLLDVRLDRARELLEGGGVRIRDVARRVGYQQPAQFTKAYRRRFGVAPSTVGRLSSPAAAR